MTASPLLIRPVCPEDASALVQLASLLDTMNLPRDPEVLAGMIAESSASFARLAQRVPTDTETPFPKGTYTLVAVRGEQILARLLSCPSRDSRRSALITCVLLSIPSRASSYRLPTADPPAPRTRGSAVDRTWWPRRAS